MTPLQALKKLSNMIEAECQCVDTPGPWDYDEIENHAQYCPLYLLDFIGRVIDENEQGSNTAAIQAAGGGK